MTVLRNLLLPGLVLLLSACTSWPKLPSTDSLPPQTASPYPPLMKLAAGDFVQALAQVRGAEPAETTVHLLSSESEDGFILAMRDALLDAGYGIRWVGDAGKDRLLQYRYEQQPLPDKAMQHVYELAIGSIEMRRSFVQQSDQQVNPATPLYVRGTDASRIRLNDEIFTHYNDALMPVRAADRSSQVQIQQRIHKDNASAEEAQHSTSAAKPRNTAPAPPASQGHAAARLPGIAPEASPLDPVISGSRQKESFRLPLFALPQVDNVFELGSSNYNDLLLGHRIVGEQILTFANDSLRLGDINKQLINRLVRRFDKRRDVFSVIGCSMGPTRLRSGNAALALGRASRVKEALLFAGVPQQQILEEGCWAGEAGNVAFPRRGVVITLYRQS